MKKSLFVVLSLTAAIVVGFGCSKGGGGGGGTPTPEPTPSGNVAEGGACTADADCVSGLLCLNSICGKAPADDGGGSAGGSAGGTTEAKDTDGDGVPDATDNCSAVANADQADMDADAKGDACDDSDGDLVMDSSDNCVSASNSDQADIDKDSLGDACDDDKDGDGVANAIDNCSVTENPAQDDMDKDGIGTLCEVSDGNAPAISVNNCPSHTDSILGVTNKYVTTTSASMTFNIEPAEGIEFSCKLDGVVVDCAGKTYSAENLSDSYHSFIVTAVDNEEDVGQAGCEWVVDTVVPNTNFDVTVTPKWRGASVKASPKVSELDIDTNFALYTVSYTYKDKTEFFEDFVSLDDFAPVLYNGVMYDLWVKAYDKAGNSGPYVKSSFSPAFNWSTSNIGAFSGTMSNINGLLLTGSMIGLVYGVNTSPYLGIFSSTPLSEGVVSAVEVPIDAPIAEPSSRFTVAMSVTDKLHLAYITKDGANYIVEHVYATNQNTWAYEIAYISTKQLSNPAIALNGNDVWIAFDSISTGRLMIVRKTADAWSNPLILDNVNVSFPAMPSIVIKEDYSIYVTYRKSASGGNTALKLNYCTDYSTCATASANWHKITIDDGDGDTTNGGSSYKNVGFSNKLLFDGAGIPKITYFGADAKAVLYTQNSSADPSTWHSASWSFTAVNSNDQPSNGYIAMGLDSSGVAHIAWYCSGEDSCQTDKLLYVPIVSTTGEIYSSVAHDFGSTQIDLVQGDMVLFAPDNGSLWICYSDTVAGTIKCTVDWK